MLSAAFGLVAKPLTLDSTRKLFNYLFIPAMLLAAIVLWGFVAVVVVDVALYFNTIFSGLDRGYGSHDQWKAKPIVFIFLQTFRLIS